MTLSLIDLALYAGALLVLFLTPGPVWLAVLARTLSEGFSGVWPLALGVMLGDILWPLAAIFGLSWLVATYSEILLVFGWFAALLFIGMGVQLIRHADRPIAADGRLTRPGIGSGFIAGFAAIMGNPKAILFYLGLLPGFFTLGALTTIDVGVIVATSALVPFIGILIFAGVIHHLRLLLQSPAALKRTHQIAGVLLVGVGVLLGYGALSA